MQALRKKECSLSLFKKQMLVIYHALRESLCNRPVRQVGGVGLFQLYPDETFFRQPYQEEDVELDVDVELAIFLEQKSSELAAGGGLGPEVQELV